MSTPEGKVKAGVKRVLKRDYPGIYLYMPVGNGMGAPSLDFVGCWKGRFFAIETKAPGKKATARQLATMGQMEAAGAMTFVVDGELSLQQVTTWLNQL